LLDDLHEVEKSKEDGEKEYELQGLCTVNLEIEWQNGEGSSQDIFLMYSMIHSEEALN
jgi:hypothetical protein